MRLALVMVAAAALAGCQARQPAVEDAWVRLPAVPGRPAAAYFIVRGGDLDLSLAAVDSPAARRVELHESMANGMRPIATLPLPSRESIAFAPGGRHAMLYDVAPAVRPGGTMTLRFDLGDGKPLSVDAKVVGAADPAP